MRVARVFKDVFKKREILTYIKGPVPWIINIWMRQEKISDKKFSLVIISDHVTSVKPMGIF